jgi:hypothetical protein
MQPNGIQSRVDNKHASNTDNCLLNSQIATGNELQKGGNMWKRTKSTSNNKNLLSHLVCIQSICSGVEHQRYCSEVTATGNLDDVWDADKMEHLEYLSKQKTVCFPGP